MWRRIKMHVVTSRLSLGQRVCHMPADRDASCLTAQSLNLLARQHWQETGAPGLVDDVVAGTGGGHEQLLIEQLIRQPHKGARPVRLLPLPRHTQHLRLEKTIKINKERLESSDQGAAAQRRPPRAPAPAAAPRPAPAR